MAALLLLAAPTVHAAPVVGLGLEWTAPAGCPGVAEVRELTARALGRPLPGGAEATTVRARVVLTEGGYALTIETRSASGTDTRQMQDPRCSVLAEATAVIAATAIDPSLAPPPLPAEAPPVLPDLPQGTDPDLIPPAPVVPVPGDMSVGTDTAIIPPAQAPGPAGTLETPGIASVLGPASEEPEPTPLPPSARKAPLRFALRLAGLADLGSVPGATGGLTWAAALLGRLWRAELSGLWLAPRTSRPDPMLEVGARVGLLAAALRGCLTPRVGRLEIPVCGGLEAGALRGEGAGAAIGEKASDVLPWLAASAGPGLIFAPIPRLALTLQVDLVVPALRSRFEAGGYGVLHRVGAAAGRVALGIELRFR